MNIIKKLRTDKRKTAKEVADFLNISTQAYYNYEKDLSVPSIESLKRLAEFYNVSADYILGITTEERPINKPKTDNKTFFYINEILLHSTLIIDTLKQEITKDNIEDWVEEKEGIRIPIKDIPQTKIEDIKKEIKQDEINHEMENLIYSTIKLLEIIKDAEYSNAKKDAKLICKKGYKGFDEFINKYNIYN